jgi:hypothetical protein
MIEDVRQIVAAVFNPIILSGIPLLAIFAIGIAVIDLFRMYRG